MRILLTNDDGIDSLGLHVLARAIVPHGDIVVAAPDSEYSGAGAALGAIHQIHPEVHQVRIDGIDEAWSVSGPPALCVMFAQLGAFGRPFDLIVSGINPGSNVGRSVYHSGTVGAALTGRTRGASGVAVSQAVSSWGVEGQAADEVLVDQLWDSAAEVAATVVSGLVADPPDPRVVVNVNVPNLPIDEIKGWRHTEVGQTPPRSTTEVSLEPKPGHEGSYKVRMQWGDAVDLPNESDGGAVMNGYVAVSWLSHLTAADPPASDAVPRALDDLLGSDR